MQTDFRRIAIECILDLGVTVVYATFVGLAIVALTTLDDGPGNLLETMMYAALLPGAVVVLILIEIGLLVRKTRHRIRTLKGPTSSSAVARMPFG